MWKFLLMVTAVGTLPAASVGQQVYLTTVDNWSFWKIRATGPMTNTNVKMTCESVGMGYPCYHSGTDSCSYNDYWISSCITYHDTDACHIHQVLSSKLCGNTDYSHCQPLDDTFVYIPGYRNDDSALGTDYQTHSGYLAGAQHSNMYALCAAPTCARSPCSHGTCTDDVGGYTCSCENGWTGQDCDQDIDECASSPCLHGICTDDVGSYTCSCENGWTGHDCDQDMDECASSPCTHGTCTDGVGSYTCSCENGWEGTNCDQDTDECVSSPCTHGVCTDNVGGYTCSCENGWDGINCDQDIDDCASSPCPHGTCADGHMSYTCSCENGWTGHNCDQDIDECASSPCTHGTCTNGLGSYTCSCENGWTGHDCDQNIDECLSYPCAHGTCANGEGGYTCSCELGWTGQNCDQDIDECASSPCLLGGTCLDHVDGYSCVCSKDATGKNCETASFAGDCYQFSITTTSHRDATRACSTNSGRMVDVRNEEQQQFLASTIAATTNVSNWLAMKTAPLPVFYSDGSPVIGTLQWGEDEASSPLDLCVFLDSSDNYKAKKAFCTEQLNYVCQSALKPCEPNVCQNGGNCTSCFGGSTTFCDCLEGFQGLQCEINTDECVSSPCQHGGTCQDQVNSYSCRCPTGYSGDNCETEIDWCTVMTCPPGWTCQYMISYFSCLAPTVRTLKSYKCNSASCPGDMYCREESGASFSCWTN